MHVLAMIVRRALWLIILAAVGGAAYAWWRERTRPPAPAPPQWPPLDATSPAVVPEPEPIAEPATEPAATASDPEPVSAELAEPIAEPDPEPESAEVAEPIAEPDPELEPDPAATTEASASVVNALVDAPEARSQDGAGAAWVAPNDDGSCPVTHPIKANDNSGIFHVPGGRFYDRTAPERCYADPQAAESDGYRQAKS